MKNTLNIHEIIRTAVTAEMDLLDTVDNAYGSALVNLVNLAETVRTADTIKEYCDLFAEAYTIKGRSKGSAKTQKSQRKLILDFLGGLKSNDAGKKIAKTVAAEKVEEFSKEKASISAVATMINAFLTTKQETWDAREHFMKWLKATAKHEVTQDAVNKILVDYMKGELILDVEI